MFGAQLWSSTWNDTYDQLSSWLWASSLRYPKSPLKNIMYLWDPRCAQGAKNYTYMLFNSWDLTYPVLKTHQVNYRNSWCNQKKAGHLIRFCKKSLFAWSRLLRSLIDVLRLDVILHFNRFFVKSELEQSSPLLYCGQHQNTHVVELIVPITLL